jgi:hypothetical protein
MAYYDSRVLELSGVVNGSNTTFTTPTAYVTGSIRIIVNGLFYEEDDDEYGWSEIDGTTIQMDNAPLTGDTIQAFYLDEDSEHEGQDIFIGSPVDPDGVLP